MPTYLNESERALVKSVLSDVLSDDDLKDQFNRTKKNQQAPIVCDSQAAVLRQYESILEEISAERTQQAARDKVLEKILRAQRQARPKR